MYSYMQKSDVPSSQPEYVQEQDIMPQILPQPQPSYQPPFQPYFQPYKPKTTSPKPWINKPEIQDVLLIVPTGPSQDKDLYEDIF